MTASRRQRVRVTCAGRQTHASAGEGRHGDEVIRAVRRCADGEGICGDLRFLGRSRGKMHVDEERQHRRGGGARRVHLGEGALEDITGQPGVASREVDRRERTGRIRVRVRVDAVEQLVGLFEAALADAQVGKSHECALAQPRAPAEAPDPDRLGERRVRFWPSSCRSEHTAVVSPAEGSDERQVPPLRDGLTHADPLVGPRDVVRVLARGEELAEHLFHHEEVVDVATSNSGQRLVEQHHPLLGAVPVHEARAEVGERGELEVGVAVPARLGQRRAELRFLAWSVVFEHADVQSHPAGL